MTCITPTPATPVGCVHFCLKASTTLAQIALGLALGAFAMPHTAAAQQPGDTAHVPYQPDALSTGQFASRTSLQDAARGSGPAAAMAQARLTNGDFQVGDRIALAVAGEPTLTDTFTVREGQLLRLPNMSDVPLRGVLHSELQDTLLKDLARFIKDPTVRATPLVRVAVIGQVPRPGFYSVAADELVTSVLMRAGGLTTTSDLKKTSVKRGDSTLYNAKALQVATTRGETVDQLSIRPGDEILVGERPPGGNTLRYLGIAAALAGIAGSIAFIATR